MARTKRTQKKKATTNLFEELENKVSDTDIHDDEVFEDTESVIFNNSGDTTAEENSEENLFLSQGNQTSNNDDETSEAISIYHDYDPNLFSPLHLYRSQNDVVGALIVHSSSEGAGRYEIGRKIGINTKSKIGNRRVSQSIQAVVKHFPQYVGQYQKTEGKYRTIKYFLKKSRPEVHLALLKKFEELTGRECPFKFGDVLKFPNTKLNTLRITDISLRRMLYVLEALKESKVILTSVKVVRYIQQRDTEIGYPFRIDKKSAMKCLLALSKNFFCRLFEAEYCEDGTKKPFEIVTTTDITSVDDPIVQEAIKVTVAEFMRQNKMFPTGVLRPWKRLSTVAILPSTSDDNQNLENLKELIKSKSELPLASKNTIDSLVVNYRRRKGLTRSSKKQTNTPTSRSSNLTSVDTLADTSTSNSSAAVVGAKKSHLPAKPYSSHDILLADKDLAAVMGSASLANIKDELVNALKGVPIALPDSAGVGSSSATADGGAPVRKRRRRRRAENPDNGETPSTMTSPKKKRVLDEVDRMCVSKQMYLRSRFTCKEKDMLLLIRAVGFFLNPIHRFWLDPTVMRDIMHEYVPESRCKTAASLLAAGSRDLNRNVRMAHLQYIVKTLSSYQEMCYLRNKFPKLRLEDTQKKVELFTEAFALAYNLLFKESQSFPTIAESDEKFDAYIAENNLSIVSSIHEELPGESILLPSDFPRRSVNPSTEWDARHCVNFNVIMSILLIDEKEGASFLNDPKLKIFASNALEEGLEQLHRDGLITKVRWADRQADVDPNTTDPTQLLRNQIGVAVFYRHFFHHQYHNDLMSLTLLSMDRFKADVIDETESCDPGSILLLSRTLMSSEHDIELVVPESLDSLIVSNEEKESSRKATKQLRYLENADLNIDLIKVLPTGVDNLNTKLDFEKVTDSFTHRVPIIELELAKSRCDVLSVVNRLLSNERSDAELVYNAIEKSGFYGLCEEELLANTGLDPLRLKRIINLLTESYDIFPCGIDTRRYILMRCANCWMVCNEELGFFPRPWSYPSGKTNLHVLKWMAESMLILIHKKPGIIIQELTGCYAFVVQPIIVEEILCLLEIIDCCHINVKSMFLMTKTSGNERTKQTVRYAVPVPGAIEKFAEFFREMA